MPARTARRAVGRQVPACLAWAARRANGRALRPEGPAGRNGKEKREKEKWSKRKREKRKEICSTTSMCRATQHIGEGSGV